VVEINLKYPTGPTKEDHLHHGMGVIDSNILKRGNCELG